ncbi:hypothetical protein [Salinibacillus xinjiangensis]|uniref:hypothetical protein n=1 Tax=Salinibacillus xinjiangensis TaxID=1229268 RepID=UPI001891556B|nr:hypothetical protein [Salinibacillus xinjiangensis]
MFKKIVKQMVKKNMSHRRYSSSGYKRRKYGKYPSKYGHHHYKRKHKSSGFFGSYSS